MKKIVTSIVIVIIIFCLWPLSCCAAVTEDRTAREMVERQQEALDLKELEDFISQVDQEINVYIPDISFSKLLEDFKTGELSFSPQEIMQGLLKFFLHEVTLNLTLLGKLLVIAVICAVLQNIQSSFEKGTVARLAYFVCFMVVMTLAMGSFKLAATTGLAAIEKMVAFMKLILPVLLVLLTTLGGLTSAALLKPFMLVFLSFMCVFVQSVIFPLIFLGAVISIVNNISENFKISSLAKLLHQATKVGIGLVLTLFIGVITVQGVAGAVVDGVTLRTAKYMTGAFVPVAGSMFADALDAVVGGTLLLKNAVGLTGVMVLGAIIIFPILKILAIALIYRLAAALMQPLGVSLMSDSLEDMAGSLFMAFAAVCSVGIMFFMTITIIVVAANFTVMLR